MRSDLIKAIRDKKLILFVGAGVSMNLGLPSYGKLIDHLATEVGFDPSVFRLSGDYLTLAEYYQIEKKRLGPLRSWMDINWHDASIDILNSSVHESIVQLGIPIIYTTNFDRWLEKAFEARKVAYSKIASVADIANVNDGVTQIVKFHGDFDDDESIVLTESSYFDRLSFESPLDIKLRSDALGRSLLFIGYSLSDINIRYLLYKIHKLWENSSYADARPSSFVFLTRPNQVVERVLHSRGLVPIVAEHDDPGDALKQFLSELVIESRGLKGP